MAAAFGKIRLGQWAGPERGAKIIRSAIAADAEQITTCARLAYARYVPLIGREPAPMLADFPAQIAAGQVHVALSDQGAVQGYIVFYPEGRHMMLESVAVLPQAAGRGIGKALIAHCENTAHRAGLNSIRLYTNEKMAENLMIYPRLGYIETGRRSEHGFNRVFFEKRLA